MTITVNGFDGNPFDQNSIFERTGPFIKTKHKLAFTGNYATGGDTLDFTNGAVNSAVPPLASQLVCVEVKGNGVAASQSNIGGTYGVVSPAGGMPAKTFTAFKLKIWTGANSEYSAGAYGTDVTGDQVFLECVWAKY